MRKTSSSEETIHHVPAGRRLCGLAAATILAVFGVAAVAKGLNGHATVRDALGLERVAGQPYMTPAAIAGKAKAAGLATRRSR